MEIVVGVRRWLTFRQGTSQSSGTRMSKVDEPE